MTDKRPLVVEHRITTDLFGCVVRYWIESDPEHGGVLTHDAWDAVAAAEGRARSELREFDTQSLARFLLAQILEANSVEVCHSDGGGTAVHRDWP